MSQSQSDMKEPSAGIMGKQSRVSCKAGAVNIFIAADMHTFVSGHLEIRVLDLF